MIKLSFKSNGETFTIGDNITLFSFDCETGEVQEYKGILSNICQYANIKGYIGLEILTNDNHRTYNCSIDKISKKSYDNFLKTRYGKLFTKRLNKHKEYLALRSDEC
jgi:hypothetical protein